MVNRGLGDQQSLRNGRPAGAIQSTSRFDGAGEIAAKTKISFNIMAVNCLSFSLIHILIVTSLGAAIAIVHGNREAFAADDRDGPSQAA